MNFAYKKATVVTKCRSRGPKSGKAISGNRPARHSDQENRSHSFLRGEHYMKKMVLFTAILSAVALTACSGGSKPAATTAAPAATTAAPAATTAAETTKAAEAASSWKPSGEVKFIVTSKAGGGSDIYTRKMIEIINGKGIADTNFVVDYMTDGGGESGRQYVADAKKGDELLTAMEYGGFANMLLNTPYRIEKFRCIAVVGEECQILLTTPQSKYASLNDAIEAAKGGTIVSISGSGQADQQMYEMMMEEFGLNESQLTYIRCSSTSDAIVECMGNHADYVFARASACRSYAESGDLVPVVALQENRFAGALDCPTIEELGYNLIKVPLWRGVCGPESMSDEAYEFYCDIFGQMAASDEWENEYCSVYGATRYQLVGADAEAYMKASQEAYLAANGIDK